MRWVTLGLVLAMPACMPIRYAPAEAPTETMPDIPAPPEAPEQGKGRLVVDVAGEHAKVAKVVEIPVTYPTSRGMRAGAHPGFIPKRRAPVHLALRPRHAARRARAGVHVALGSRAHEHGRRRRLESPAAIRHALGRDKPVNWQYFTGFMMTLMGGMLVTGGGAVTAIGFATNASDRQPPQTRNNTTRLRLRSSRRASSSSASASQAGRRHCAHEQQPPRAPRRHDGLLADQTERPTRAALNRLATSSMTWRSQR